MAEVPDSLLNETLDSFRRQIRPAVEEARTHGMPELADLLESMRDLILAQTPEAVRSRLAAMGVATFPPESAAVLMRIAGSELARQVLEEARLQQAEQKDNIWQSRSVRMAVVGGILSLILTSVGTLVAVLALLLHHG